MDKKLDFLVDRECVFFVLGLKGRSDLLQGRNLGFFFFRNDKIAFDEMLVLVRCDFGQE